MDIRKAIERFHLDLERASMVGLTGAVIELPAAKWNSLRRAVYMEVSPSQTTNVRPNEYRVADNEFEYCGVKFRAAKPLPSS